MILFFRVRRMLAGLLLRGWLGHRWVQWKVRRLEKQFCRELVAASTKPRPAPTFPKLNQGAPLRKILLVADVMWEANDLVPELEQICPVATLNLAPALGKDRGRHPGLEVAATTAEAFLDANPGLDPDVVFLYARPSLLSERLFALLRKRWSVTLLGMNLDDKIEFLDYRIFSTRNDDYQRWARLFDLNITNGLAVGDWYRLRGLPCIYSPQGVHRPAGLQPPESLDFKHELSFLGSRKPERSIIVNQLIEAGIPIQLFGSGWPNAQWVDDPNAIYRSSQINLGIGLATPSLALTTTKGRDFECPGVGACYLTTYNWELASHYEIGKEILCYRSIEELIEMFSFYRKRPEECLRIAQAAWRRCSNEHTWEKRFRRIFQQMGFAP